MFPSPDAPPDLLAPLAARYGAARGGPVVIPPEPDGVVRAMPIVLRLERPPAGRTAVLEAAAGAALAVCLDPRAADEWRDALDTWVESRIRKIARRARGAHWAAVQELAGVTVTVGDAQARRKAHRLNVLRERRKRDDKPDHPAMLADRRRRMAVASATRASPVQLAGPPPTSHE